MTIVVHAKLTVTIAIDIIKIVFHVARRDIVFTRVSLKIMLVLIGRYENNAQVYDQIQQEVVTLFRIIHGQDEYKMDIYNKIKHT